MSEQKIPQGYKQTGVGLIPEDWEIDRIGNVVSITTGDKNTQDKVIDGLYPFFVRSQQVEKINSFSFDGEAVLTAGDGVGTGKIFHYINGKFDFHQRVYLLHNFVEKLDGYYFYIFFSNHFYERIMSMTAKSSVDSVRREMIADMPIILPSKCEQTAIATALSDVDTLISELEKLIAKKQAIKTATMQQLLTGRTRLPQFALREDGTKKGYKQSELGEVPEDWEVVAMGDLGSTYGGLSGKSKQDFGHGNSLYVPFTNVMANVVVDVDNLEKVDVREAQNNLALGDLLFNGSSETPEEVCFSALVSADIRKLYLNSFCFGFRSNQKNAYLPLYLAYWFRSEVGRAAVLVMAQGSTRYNISKSQFMKLTIVLPDTEEQTAIATTLSDMDAEIEVLEQRLGKTRQIKQGMMQELLTGKTRLIKPSKEVIHE